MADNQQNPQDNEATSNGIIDYSQQPESSITGTEEASSSSSPSLPDFKRQKSTDDVLNYDLNQEDGNEATAALESNNNHIAAPRTPQKQPFPFVAASPPRFVAMEEVMKAANGVSNMYLAHEIAVDQEFRLEKHKPPTGSLKSTVEDVMVSVCGRALRSFCNALSFFNHSRKRLSGTCCSHS